MKQEIIQALECQATHELLASQTYLAMSFWCEVSHFSGFAEFFRKQADEEIAHARKLLDYLVDRDVFPKVGLIAAPPSTFESLISLVKMAYDLERSNTAGIHACYKAARTAEDYPTEVLLHWFISEQVEEEAWSDKMLAKTQQATCSGSLAYLDHHICKELAD